MTTHTDLCSASAEETIALARHYGLAGVSRSNEPPLAPDDSRSAAGGGANRRENGRSSEAGDEVMVDVQAIIDLAKKVGIPDFGT